MALIITKEQKRGQLTSRIQAYALHKLGRKITQTELRLMPYIMSVMINEQRINPDKINKEEREILRGWRAAGYIEGGVSGLAITEDFWNTLCQFVFLGYVDLF